MSVYNQKRLGQHSMKLFIASAAAAVLLSLNASHAEEARIWGSLGTQLRVNATEMQARYIAQTAFWNLQPVLGVSVAGNDSAWVGVGSAYTWRPAPDGLFLRVTSMVGVHKNGNGRKLSGPVQFRTGLDVGMSTLGGMEYGLGVDHRSSAGLYKPNPGLNTAYLFVSVPLR